LKHILEVIAFSIESCSLAQASGAQRIELCDNAGEGGTTPSFGFLQEARKKVSIELYPIIRPRGGDFLYSPEEFEIMKQDIRLCKKLGCDGIVAGMLTAEGMVDKAKTTQLADLAYPMGLTFHRAFDRTADPFLAMEDIIESGCERILTSGQMPDALAGAGLIAELIRLSAERIIIMPGSGIRSSNITEIAQRTGAVEFHSSARKSKESKMQFINTNMKEQLTAISLDEVEVKAMADALSKL
jgi:copper homeostasis protein